MGKECDNNCFACSESCKERKDNFREKLNELSSVKKVIGIVSGKGGVGKSLITALCAVMMQREGNKVAILDADITGPSIPKIFGLKDKIKGEFVPALSKTGIRIMSVNLLTEEDTSPVIWRGPLIAGIVKQFWTDVIWGDVDYMFVDMPPGTGDVPLTVFQSLPLDGIIVVTSPQELVSMIVSKAVNMAKMMNIPVLGIVENMSYINCPDCGKTINVFGESHIEDIAKEYKLEVLAKLPLDPEFSNRCDKGEIEEIKTNLFGSVLTKLKNLEKN